MISECEEAQGWDNNIIAVAEKERCQTHANLMVEYPSRDSRIERCLKPYLTVEGRWISTSNVDFFLFLSRTGLGIKVSAKKGIF